MKTIILGRNGDQPFEIKNQPGVSKEHAKLTISDENGHQVWTLEDLDSANGTTVKDKNGKSIQVSKKIISPDTLICLGPENANGCQFYARHADDANSYSADFDQLEETEAMISSKMDRLDKRAKNIRMAIGVISAVTLLVSLTSLDTNLRMMLLRLGTFATMISSFFFDPTKEKKAIKDLGEKLFVCPNPACPNTLSAKDIHNRRCPRCKAQG